MSNVIHQREGISHNITSLVFGGLSNLTRGFGIKCSDKSTTSYDMVDIKSYTKSLTCKYLVNKRHMLHIQGILLQHLKLNWPICQLNFFY